VKYKNIIKLLLALLPGYAIAQSPTVIKNTTKSGIMTALYNNYNAKENTSDWLCNDKSILKTFSLNNTTHFTAKMLYADSTVNGANKQLYVLLSLNPVDNECYACAPVLKSLLFIKNATTWILSREGIGEQIGSMGDAPPFKAIKFKNNIAFLFEGGFTNMGISSGFIELSAWYNGIFKPLLTILDASYTNEGNCVPTSKEKCFGYDGKIKFITTGKDFDDILFTKKGTDLKKNKVVKIDSAITYKFVNGNYVKQ